MNGMIALDHCTYYVYAYIHTRLFNAVKSDVKEKMSYGERLANAKPIVTNRLTNG